MAGFSNTQARDANGRWISMGGGAEWLSNNRNELLVAGALIGGGLATYGIYGSAVSGQVLSGSTIVKQFVVRKVGPLATGPLGSVKNLPQTVEAFQYSKLAKGTVTRGGAFSAGTGTAGTIGAKRYGAETITKGVTKNYGAPKPFDYENLDFKYHPRTKKLGKGILIGTPIVTGTAHLYEKSKN